MGKEREMGRTKNEWTSEEINKGIKNYGEKKEREVITRVERLKDRWRKRQKEKRGDEILDGLWH